MHLTGIIQRSQFGQEIKQRRLVLLEEMELTVSGQRIALVECRCCAGRHHIEIFEDE